MSSRSYNAIAIVTVAIFAGFVFEPANAQSVGEMKRVVENVTATKSGSLRTLKRQSPVFSSETLAATVTSHGEVLLNDKSKVIVGPGATLLLDDFIVTNKSLKSGTLKLAKGAFRFISATTGKKADYRIKTPLATIGIRGTKFDVYVRDKGVTDVVLFSGQVEVCANGGTCNVMSSKCDIVRVSAHDTIDHLPFLRSGNRTQENANYELIQNQLRFPLGWMANTAMCSVRAFIEQKAPADFELEEITHCIPVGPSTPTQSSPPDKC